MAERPTPTRIAEVVAARLDAGPVAVGASSAMLSDAERRRAARFAFDRDRRRFVLARAELRRLLAARLGVRPTSIDLVYGPHGKPALGCSLAASGLRFNVSHRDDMAVYAFAWGREVGVDVEAVRLVPGADRIAARTFSRAEDAAYRALEPSDRPLGFFRCWTRKEAFVKATGEGLSRPLGGFDVSLAPHEPARILRVGETPGDACGWTMEDVSPAPGYVAAVVGEVA